MQLELKAEAKKRNNESKHSSGKKLGEKIDEELSKTCKECGKEFSSNGGMRIHYFQAHTKSTGTKVAKKKIKQVNIIKYGKYLDFYLSWCTNEFK